MRLSKKTLIITCIMLVLLLAGFTYQLPYYIYKPGLADDLAEIVEVEKGYSAKGSLHLVTVSGSQATPIDYLVAKLLPYHEILPLEEARPEGISDKEYMQYQLFLMENSQHAAMEVAYKAAGKDVEVIANGVFVIHVVEDMPAEGMVEPGDKIIAVDGTDVKGSKELTEYVQHKKAGDYIQLTIDRDGKKVEKSVEIAQFEEIDKIGIGIQLVTDEEIEVTPNMSFHSGKIGGPSAGLMFSLEIYNQLTNEDITKGYNIVGTGEIDAGGAVHRIGGIDKKVVAADQEGADIFFAPNELGIKGSNYEEAKETAEDIQSDMEIVPVDSFKDALDYLEKLSPKA